MREWPSLVGRKFGWLKVIAQAESSTYGKRKWLCECVCEKQVVVFGHNLVQGTTTSCGCKKERDLKGQHIGQLTVLERSGLYGSRGNRRVRLWECRCDCGTITYKATDTLTNSDVNMCQDCAAKYAAAKAREGAGYVSGTQLSKINKESKESNNLSGVRGVYLDPKTGKYRARLKFQGKLYNLGTHDTLQQAIEAREKGEKEIYGTFLAAIGNNKSVK